MAKKKNSETSTIISKKGIVVVVSKKINVNKIEIKNEDKEEK